MHGEGSWLIMIMLMIMRMTMIMMMRTRMRMRLIMITIALKGAIRDFSLLQSPHRAANCLQHVRSSGVLITCNTSNAYHVQHIEHLSRACRVPRGVRGQFSCHVRHSLHRIYFSFILLHETINRRRRGGNRSTLRNP